MKGSINYTLFFVILFLVVFGMVMISSVSVYDSFRITKEQVELGIIDEPHNHFFLTRNIIHVVIGCVLFVVMAKVPYTFFERHARLILLLTVFMLIFVLIPGLGVKINGARGWFKIPGIPFLLQPTEFMKLGLIIYLAYFLKIRKEYIRDLQQGFIPFLVILGVIGFLLVLQPDLGTMIIVTPIALAMFFVAGGNFKYILTLGAVGLVGASILYVAGSYDSPDQKGKFSYIYDRVNAFVVSNKQSIEDGTLHQQTHNSLIAIGSGGVLGLGFGKSIQKYGFLPESQGDFIFSIIAEELGFIGVLVLISLYLFILYKGFHIALRTTNLFGRYLAVGITSWILVQAFINIGVNLNSFPNTWVTLPFVSYGGSSLIALLFAAGILLNISRGLDYSVLPATQRNRLQRRRVYL